uniref:CSON003452 protein n=1 Tax=Culicoides sonorensis TaxID=179676 RepID=A0A336MSK1_CULSO
MRSPSRNSSKLNSPYSRFVPLPFVKIPHPDIMIVPERKLVIVAGNAKFAGLCDVTPTSMDPLHLSTSRSIRISKSSLSCNARCVMTTPLLNSSKGLRRSAVRKLLLNLTNDPHLFTTAYTTSGISTAATP